MLYIQMRFEWDERKNMANLQKHGISFETAILIFDDPNILSDIDQVVDGETRWQSVGLINGVLFVLVAHTYAVDPDGEEVVRLISARKAVTRERRSYEDAL